MLSQQRREEQGESTTAQTTDNEPIVVKTKVTVHPITYRSDSSSADVTYKVSKFDENFSESPKEVL